MTRCSTHKHIGIYLDEKVNSCHHITEEIAKANNKGTDFIKKLNNALPRGGLLTIKKNLLDQIGIMVMLYMTNHRDIILNKSNNSVFLRLKIYRNRQVFDLIHASGI